MQSQQALLLAGKSMIEQAKPADDPARLARPGSYYPKRGAAGNWRAGAGQGRAGRGDYGGAAAIGSVNAPPRLSSCVASVWAL